MERTQPKPHPGVLVIKLENKQHATGSGLTPVNLFGHPKHPRCRNPTKGVSPSQSEHREAHEHHVPSAGKRRVASAELFFPSKLG